MGRLLLILLVTLLPLRGWSAERMALHMTQSQAIVEVARGQVFMAGMPADCPMMAQTTSKADKSPSPSKSHSGCLTCLLCMSLAAQYLSSPNLLAYEKQAPPVSITGSFISADLTRQAKPPIL